MARYRLARHGRPASWAVLVAVVTLAGTLVVAGGASPASPAGPGGDPYRSTPVVDVDPDPDAVETTVVADEAVFDIGNGVMARGQAFNGTVPGPQFRLKVGDRVTVHFENRLDTEVSGIHWHGIELDNRSDGTPLSQDQVPPGGRFLYRFQVTRPGVFWYHPHHHGSTNQVFKGLYGSMLVADSQGDEAALVGAGVLPPAADTRALVLSDTTVCKAPGSNDATTYPADPTLPWAGGPSYPGQPRPYPVQLCETAAMDESGNPRPQGPFQAGEIPNIQNAGPARTNEGQTVLTNGRNVGARAGSPASPGALAAGASTLAVSPGQGVRFQVINAASLRYFRLRLTDSAGAQIPLVRVGGEGGLLDAAVVEGGTPGGYDTKFGTGEVVLGPGDRADVVAAIPATATGVATLWTLDFSRTGLGFSRIPTVPVAHLEVGGPPREPAFTIAAGTLLLARPGVDHPLEPLGAPDGTLVDPAALAPPKVGSGNPTVTLTAGLSGEFGIDGVAGAHDTPGDYRELPRGPATRYARLGDTLELAVENSTEAHHPFHLHGFSIQPLRFQSIGGAKPDYEFPYTEFVDEVDLVPGYRLVFRVRLDDRPLMDGTTMGGGLGRWVMHCHIFFHATLGMISELIVVDGQGQEHPFVDADDTTTKARPGRSASMTGTVSDPDGGPVALSASVGQVTDGGDGTWAWSGPPVAGTVFVTATDASGNRGQTGFEVVVVPADGLSLFRPTTATWLERDLGGASETATAYGAADDVPVPDDFDGDGLDDVAVFRPSTALWAHRGSGTGTDTLTTFGVATDLAVPGDYDGDGRADLAVFRPATGQWFVRSSSTGTVSADHFGLEGDVPVVGDYDGDGRTDRAVFRPATGDWFARTAAGDLAVAHGAPGDVPAPGDYDGDGRSDPAVFRPSTGTWSWRASATGTIAMVALGVGDDRPQPGDFDGDGRTDPAVFRPSSATWFVIPSATGGLASIAFGAPSDLPLELAQAIYRSSYPA